MINKRTALFERQYGIIDDTTNSKVAIVYGAVASHLLAVDNSELSRDWLLPKCDIQFSEPDMYEHLLMNTYMLGQYSGPAPLDITILPETVKHVSTLGTVAEGVDPGFFNGSISGFPEKVLSTHDNTLSSRQNSRLGERTLQNAQCAHCKSDKTSLWRRYKGRLVCNACALYEKLHGVPRPQHLLNHTIKRRNRSDRCRKN